MAIKITPTTDEYKAAIRDQAATMIATLDTIQGTAAPSNAQIIWAIKKLAEHQQKIIRFLVRNL